MQNTQLVKDVGTQESRGRRWVYRAGAVAAKQPHAPILFVAVAVLGSIFGVLWGILLEDAIVGLFAVAFKGSIWLLIALLWYERRRFYEIIQEQEQRIGELERGLQHTR
jgi:hypothetical protein